MGAKTALLAFADGEIRSALLGATRSERAETEALVRQVHPGYVVEPADDGTLLDDINPPDDITYATKLAGLELFCDWRLVFDRPSELPEHLRQAGVGSAGVWPKIIRHRSGTTKPDKPCQTSRGVDDGCAGQPGDRSGRR
ncbi:DUF6928 family protein [Micromonospora cremea]|uniref:Uncharacterized protein n=1 Tax=Micromonospora cremea TaxID=709881 RepID=A0A1N6AFD3_9ACTN|nr:hypothetical protein [Micromonospora cremea]SIN32745.1 hypothetical protein SAMN04489832_5432 [Micromonospora cremea]